MACAPSEDSDQPRHPPSLTKCPGWSESLLSAWRKLGSLATHWVHSEHSDQTGWMPRLIWVFAGRTCHFVGFVMRWLNCNDPRYSDRQVWVLSLIWVYTVTVCPSVPIFWTHYNTVKLYNSYFRTITAIFWVWFDFCFTALQLILGNFGHSQLT